MVVAPRCFSFPPFRLDLSSGRLQREGQDIALRPKTFAVLGCLLERAGQLVSKDELLTAVWGATCVSEVALAVCIRELRQALGDDARAPRFLGTVHGRGYRFIAPFITGPPFVQRSMFNVPRSGTQDSTLSSQLSVLVGREAELAQLHGWLDKALSGERQFVFVTGEPGIGKTALVETFARQITAQADLWYARGQCLPAHGAGEAYLLVLEIFSQLGHGPSGRRLIAHLRRYAPLWLVQLPWLINDTELDVIQRKVLGVLPQRMLRECGELLEALAIEKPIVLFLEDLHWSDPSTLTLLTYLARRRLPARLLVIGTYRPGEMEVAGPGLRMLRQDLQCSSQCGELPLSGLAPEAVAAFLTVRAPHNIPFGESIDTMARKLYQRTEGHPFFIVTLLDECIQRGVMGVDRERETAAQYEAHETLEKTIPQSVRLMIEQQFERLSAKEQQMLEAASVAGLEFPVAVIAEQPVTLVQTERICAALARRGQFLRPCGIDEWPDGAVSARYAFLHALYQEVLYNRLPVGLRQQLHLRLGGRKEQGYGQRAREIAAELAAHFEQGRNYSRAVEYLYTAATNDLQRYAYREVVTHLTNGLRLLERLPETPERKKQAMVLLSQLSGPVMALEGESSPRLEQIYARLSTISQQLGESTPPFWVLRGLTGLYLARGELHAAHALGKQLMNRALTSAAPNAQLWAHYALGVVLSWKGELKTAYAHLKRVNTFYNARRQPPSVIDPKVLSLVYLSSCLCLCGKLGKALQASAKARSWAQKIGSPYSLLYALTSEFSLRLLFQDTQTALKQAVTIMTLCREHEFSQNEAIEMIIQAGVLIAQRQVEAGVTQMRQGIAASRAIGMEGGLTPWLIQLAVGYGKLGQHCEGLAVVNETLTSTERRGEHLFTAELYRVKGELLLQSDGRNSLCQHEQHEEECFLTALTWARQQEAKLWELRTAVSLSKLWRRQGKQQEARQLLADILPWFANEVDIEDLREARSLLSLYS